MSQCDDPTCSGFVKLDEFYFASAIDLVVQKGDCNHRLYS